MKIIEISNKQFLDYKNCMNLAKKAIQNYAGDKAQLRAQLCHIVDIMPNVAYLDIDVLECNGIEAENSEWVECDESEMEYDNEKLKEIINEREFDHCDLNLRGSGSIMFTLFGDAYRNFM